MFNLLATISLRRLTANLEELEGYACVYSLLPQSHPLTSCSASATAGFGYFIAIELLKQLEDWQAHLPGPLHFRLDNTPLHDLRKSNLRCMYFVHRAILSWPPLAMRLGLKHVSDAEAAKLNQPMLDYGASKCLGAARTAVRAGEALMATRSVLLHITLRWYFAMTMILLLAYSDTAQFDGHEPRRDGLLIQEAYQTMARWKTITFLGPPLAKMKETMVDKGII